MTANEEPREVHRVQIRIPPFWADDPEMWFAQVESQFLIAGITTDETKYNHIAGNLEARYAKEVRDVLTSPPTVNKYDKLKTELTRRLSVSQEQRTKQLLEREELGDRKPSQFLRHLQYLAGTTLPENLLRSLWMNRLPSNTQAILATQTKTLLAEVADLADAITDTNAQTINEATTSHDNTLQSLVEEIGQLKTHIKRMENTYTHHQPHERSRSSDRSQSRRSGYSHQRKYPERRTYDTCWYHFKFGPNARNCKPPCKEHQPGNDEGSQ